jgi:hypothetical protein
MAGRGRVSRAVIRAATSIGLAISIAACAASAPVGTSVWTAPRVTSEPARDGVLEMPSPEAPGIVVDAAPIEPRPSDDSGGKEELSEAGSPPKSILLVDDAPARVSERNKPAMTWPAIHTRPRRRPGRPYHPDPRIVIDVLDARGASQADLQRTARNAGYWPFRGCYEDGLRRDQELSGKVSLALSISASGRVEQSSVTGSTLRDKVVVACVAREARQLSFSVAESRATAATEVSLATGDEPVAVLLPAAGAEELRRSLQNAWPAAEQCYARALVIDPRLGGRIELLFRVDIHGELAEVSAGSTHLADSDLGRCVLDVYRSARLAMHETNHERHFVYALHFEEDPTPSAPERP